VGKVRYQPTDYRDELEEMVAGGLTTLEFIQRSKPSRQWFTENVMPICTLSKCHGCGAYFNPTVTGTLVSCQLPRCPVVEERKLR
jgi:hypothetical protein